MNDKNDKQNYVICRINDAISASKEGKDMMEALAEIDADNQVEVAKMEVMFGNKDSYLKSIDEMITNTHLTYTCNCCAEVEYLTLSGKSVETQIKKRSLTNGN